MTSHRCSVRDVSSEYAGHGNMLMLLAPRKFCMILAVWDLALSRWLLLEHWLEQVIAP